MFVSVLLWVAMLAQCSARSKQVDSDVWYSKMEITNLHLQSNWVFSCEQYCNAVLQHCCASCLDEIENLWQVASRTLPYFSMFIAKLMANVSHKAVILCTFNYFKYFNTILNAISLARRTEREHLYNYDCKFLLATCTSILQHWIAKLLAREHLVWL